MPDRPAFPAGAIPAQAGAGRFAPTPSGDLHLGNLRTALLAWLFARSTHRDFVVRVDDLDTDRTRPGCAERQLADLAALGLDWDGPVVRQSERGAGYQAALDRLARAGLVYECYCTRREIQQAATAPHGDPAPDGSYPGTCRDLTPAQRRERRTERPAALRLRAGVTSWTVHDQVTGEFTAAVDDLVLRRTDGVPAYNLAVVVDDADQQVDQVVRGADLLPSTPRQAYLAHLLGLPAPAYAHVPLVVNPAGRRLAKRDGAVTLPELLTGGWQPLRLTGLLAASLGLISAPTGAPPPVDPADLVAGFDPARLPRVPWMLDPAQLLPATTP